MVPQPLRQRTRQQINSQPAVQKLQQLKEVSIQFNGVCPSLGAHLGSKAVEVSLSVENCWKLPGWHIECIMPFMLTSCKVSNGMSALCDLRALLMSGLWLTDGRALVAAWCAGCHRQGHLHEMWEACRLANLPKVGFFTQLRLAERGCCARQSCITVTSVFDIVSWPRINGILRHFGLSQYRVHAASHRS